jgi:hypothetical protein
MTTSLSSFSSVVKDGDEPGGLSSYFGFFLKCKKDDKFRSWFIVIFGCFVSIAQDDNKPPN